MKTLKELRELTIEELDKELQAALRKKFSLQVQKAYSNLPKSHLICASRKYIAQIKTLYTEKVRTNDGK